MKRALLALSLSVALTGCALDQQAAPSLTGPSELGMSVTLVATPDVVVQDGASQSVVSLVARDGSGNPLAGRSFYTQTRVGSTLNIGSLSATSVTTDSQGRASVTFTAPSADLLNIASVMVEFIPVGSNAQTTSTRIVSIRMVRPS